MTVLHLGVIDVPYSFPDQDVTKELKKHGKNRRFKARRDVKPSNQTTGDVAQWLENKYNIMDFFYGLYQERIVAAIEQSLGDAFEALADGAPSSLDIYGAAVSQIEANFKQFLSNREMDGQPGVPTKASLEGISRRFKKGKKQGPRPSFIDTGLYESSFKAWAEK